MSSPSESAVQALNDHKVFHLLGLIVKPVLKALSKSKFEIP